LLFIEQIGNLSHRISGFSWMGEEDIEGGNCDNVVRQAAEDTREEGESDSSLTDLEDDDCARGGESQLSQTLCLALALILSNLTLSSLSVGGSFTPDTSVERLDETSVEDETRKRSSSLSVLDEEGVDGVASKRVRWE
jgi:hypothetical protein